MSTSAEQGSTLSFDNIIWNTGNDTDTFNINVQSSLSTFPAGTVWLLLRDNGASPLTDTNNDGVVDTGPVLPGNFSRVTLQIKLPPGFAGDNGGLGFDLTKIARSVTDASVEDSVTDHLDEITGNSVDLINIAPAGSAGALGEGPGPESSPVSVVVADGDNVALFDLYVTHQGSASLGYKLNAYGSATGDSLPSDWQLLFKDAVTGTPITHTRLLAFGESQHIIAELQLPVSESAGQKSIWFVADSISEPVSDIKHDAVQISANSSLVLQPGLSAKLEPGGSVVYEHLLINTGNTTITDVFLTLADSRPNWGSVIFLDTNRDGALGPGDEIFSTDLILLPGESRDVFVKVFAPATAAPLQLNVTAVAATWDGGSELVQLQDLSTVDESRVVILKEQAIDIGCDGEPDSPTGFVATQIEIEPGNNCVVYRLTATNLGDETSYNVKIHDYTPPFTVYRSSATCSLTPCWILEPDQDDVGTISAETSQLLPNKSYFLQFVVRVR